MRFVERSPFTLAAAALAVATAVLVGGTPSSARTVANVSLPARAAFYYPWYPETWKVGGALPHYRPALGFYSSSAASVVDAHVRALDYARVDVALASWWGPSTHSEATRIPLLL